MPLSVAELQPALYDLFHDSADQLAREVGFCRRRRKLSGSAFAQSLVFGLLHQPDSSLESLARFAHKALGLTVSPQAFDRRFDASAADFLRELFARALDLCFNTASPALLPLLRRFRGVYLRDATLVNLPAALAGLFPGHQGRGRGGGQASAKLVFELELTSGVLTAASVLAGRDNEKTAEAAGGPLPAVALLLEDMGFLSGERLQACGEQGAYFLTRVPAWTAFFDEGGRRLDLAALLRGAPGWHLERAVRIFHKGKLAVRLLAVRLPKAEAAQRRRRVRREAKQRGRPVSRDKLKLCDWNVLVTNIPAALLSVWEAWELRRVRWQVELLFKAFKSEGRLDETASRRPARVVCELYAKLLAVVVQQWLLLAGGYVSLRQSLRKASREVRRRAKGVVKAMGRLKGLAKQIKKLAKGLYRRCRVQRRRRQPSTFGRLVALDRDFDQPHEGPPSLS